MEELKQDKSVLAVKDYGGTIGEWVDCRLTKSTDMEKVLELASARGIAFYKYEQGKKYWEMEEI
jgi:hypothetical protein